jgi:hypothetical protein
VEHSVFDQFWECARADSFDAPPFVLELRKTKLH